MDYISCLIFLLVSNYITCSSPVKKLLCNLVIEDRLPGVSSIQPRLTNASTFRSLESGWRTLRFETCQGKKDTDRIHNPASRERERINKTWVFRACLQREVWDTPGDVERMELHEIEAELLEHDKCAEEAEWMGRDHMRRCSAYRWSGQLVGVDLRRQE